ncbi:MULTISPECIES: hypothetical protein [Vibrio]|uniref:hypothetical protein n=1 Tax=Vibrio TaxID=662 RepID=UPI00046F23A9|nr:MULTISPECIES: hypothetical protein [Vibrio]ANP65637.1 hypothetical protein BAU10_11755 [Vibrio alginolyticus]MBE8568156.1 hypothetical protein [Vibrio sp. OPT46]MBE8579490.1 hypothetical protein [Vibrio sp. OPT41]MBS9866112.1 hypothetical protein [Vibrio alginolyticus]MBS9890050.1 hypothetical protein [Vibrio alginolyticus]
MKHLRTLIVILLIAVILTIAPYFFKFHDLYQYATTQDFANFGTYISGILTPIFTLVSILFLGLQVIESSKQSKLDRVISEHKISLDNLISSLANEKHLTEVEDQAYQSYLRGENVYLSCSEFYRNNSRMIESFGVVSQTLSHVKKLDEKQYNISRGLVISAIDRDKLGKVERLKFYLDNYRYSSNPEHYSWICEESKQYVEK